VVSSDPNYEYGNPDAQIRAFAAGPTGKRDLRWPAMTTRSKCW
jgi:two-component system heavy metal sensor histidine kinase CusS